MEQPDSSTRAGVDNREAAGQYRRMEDRTTLSEKAVAVMQADITTIRSNYATKEDLAELKGATKEDLAELKGATREDLATLKGATKADFAELKAAISELKAQVFEAINAQTWRLITWVAAIMSVYTGVIYLIARHVQ